MKMRKKLAALLAAAMIASVMPMTAFAASDNRVSKVVKVAAETELTGSDRPTLRIKLKDGMATGESFFLTLDGASWLDEDKQGNKTNADFNDEQAAHAKSRFKVYDSSGTLITAAPADFNFTLNGDDLRVEYDENAANPIAVDTLLEFTLEVFVDGDEATIEIDKHNSSVDEGKYVFAKSSDDATTELVIDDAADFAQNGKVAKMTLREPFKGAFASNTDGSAVTADDAVYLAEYNASYAAGNTVAMAKRDAHAKVITDARAETPPATIRDATDRADKAQDNFERNLINSGNLSFTLELRDSDFEFYQESGYNTNGTPKYATMTGRRGFSGDKGTIDVKSDLVTITLPSKSVLGAAKSIGEFELEGIKVRAKKNAAKGEVRVIARNLNGKLLDGTQTIVVANHTDYTTKLAMKKDDYEVKAGQELEVEFTLSETIKNSLLNNRSIEFNLSNGAKFKAGSIEARATKKDKDANYATWTEVEVDNASNKYNSFEFDNTRTGEKAEYDFKATILVPNNFEGNDIVLTAEGNALTETHEVVAAKVVKPVTVEVTPMDVKVGLRKQVGGKVVIKENAKEAILRNYTDEAKNSFKDAPIVITIQDGLNDGLKITDADIKVTEGDLLLDLDGKVVSGGSIIIPVKRQSTVPSTIEITNIELTADRSVPEGKYDIKVGGAALSKNTRLAEFYNDNALRDDVSGTGTNLNFMDPVAVTEFINITTKNTEDFTGVTSAEVNFVVGSSQYLVNGEAKDMDAAAYVKDGRTMVPVRYVASALGITEDKIVWEGGAAQTATILADKVIQVKLGSKTMVVNGANVPMTAAAEIKDGRTFVPVAEIARALNVSVVWDEATKTATFNAAK